MYPTLLPRIMTTPSGRTNFIIWDCVTAIVTREVPAAEVVALPDYDGMKKAEAVALAQVHGMKINSKTTKKAAVAFLRAQSN